MKIKVISTGFITLLICISCNNDSILTNSWNEETSTIQFAVNNEVETKGSIIEESSAIENFGVIAYSNNNETFSPDFMDNVKVSKTADNEWSYSPIKYWTTSNVLSFYSYSPYADASSNGIDITYSEQGIILSYTTPIDVEQQPDLMVATPQLELTNTQSPINLEMKHALTAIGFTVNGDGEKVTKIGFKNIYTSGEIDITASSPTWQLLSSSSSSYWAGLPSNGIVADNSGDLVINSNGYLMMLPQQLPADAQLVVEIDDVEKTLDIGGTNWVMGEKKIYDISINSNTVWMLADFSATNYPTGDYWIIGDTYSTASSYKYFEGLFEALNTVSQTTGLDITIEFINLTSLVRNIANNYTIYNSSCLKTLLLPAATRIRSDAMSTCSTLTKVEMPLVDRIEDNAFRDCIMLSDVYAPLAERIGDCAFMNIDAISSIDLPSATTLGDSVFAGCSNLRTISLPDATTVGEYAFLNCTQLSDIDLSSVTSLGNGAFSYCRSLRSITLPLLKIISNNTFEYCSNLSTVSLPYAYMICEYAFSSCSNLRTMELSTARGAELNEVESEVFRNAGISNTTLTIGDTCGDVQVSGNSLVCSSGTYRFYEIIQLYN